MHLQRSISSTAFHYHPFQVLLLERRGGIWIIWKTFYKTWNSEIKGRTHLGLASTTSPYRQLGICPRSLKTLFLFQGLAENSLTSNLRIPWVLSPTLFETSLNPCSISGIYKVLQITLMNKSIQVKKRLSSEQQRESMIRSGTVKIIKC